MSLDSFIKLSQILYLFQFTVTFMQICMESLFLTAECTPTKDQLTFYVHHLSCQWLRLGGRVHGRDY